MLPAGPIPPVERLSSRSFRSRRKTPGSPPSPRIAAGIRSPAPTAIPRANPARPVAPRRNAPRSGPPRNKPPSRQTAAAPPWSTRHPPSSPPRRTATRARPPGTPAPRLASQPPPPLQRADHCDHRQHAVTPSCWPCLEDDFLPALRHPGDMVEDDGIAELKQDEGEEQARQQRPPASTRPGGRSGFGGGGRHFGER